MASIATADFGPRAHLLPGPEVMANFLRRPPEFVGNSTGVAKLRGHRGVFIRWFPHHPGVERGKILNDLPTTEGGVWERIHDTQRHLRAFAEVSDGAVEVASHRSFPTEHPFRPGEWAIVTTIEKRQGDSVNYSMSKRYNGHDPRNAKSFYASVGYLRWGLEGGEKKLMGDNMGPTQFLMGRRNAPNAIVDVDSVFYDLTPEWLDKQIIDLTRWESELPSTLGLVAVTGQILQDIRQISMT